MTGGTPSADGSARGTCRSTTVAVGTAAAWAAALALLAGLWIRTPLSGPGPMFLAWSGPALALAGFSAAWLHRLALPQVKVTRARIVVGLLLWVAAGATLPLAPTAAELALDGFVLRRPFDRAVGLAVGWVPGAFGLAICVIGLAAALEARYRIEHGDA